MGPSRVPLTNIQTSTFTPQYMVTLHIEYTYGTEKAGGNANVW